MCGNRVKTLSVLEMEWRQSFSRDKLLNFLLKKPICDLIKVHAISFPNMKIYLSLLTPPPPKTVFLQFGVYIYNYMYMYIGDIQGIWDPRSFQVSFHTSCLIWIKFYSFYFIAFFCVGT